MATIRLESHWTIDLVDAAKTTLKLLRIGRHLRSQFIRSTKAGDISHCSRIRWEVVFCNQYLFVPVQKFSKRTSQTGDVPSNTGCTWRNRDRRLGQTFMFEVITMQLGNLFTSVRDLLLGNQCIEFSMKRCYCLPIWPFSTHWKSFPLKISPLINVISWHQFSACKFTYKI